MDVRCEKCNTEYELDESRLKPGGVTVKCTTCGHMFKIRKRAQTQSGIPVGVGPGVAAGGSSLASPTVRDARVPTGAPAAPMAAAPSAPIPSPIGGAAARSGGASRPLPDATARDRGPRQQTGSGPVTAGEGERNWIIRLDNGETRTCKELGMLQQWIITGSVSRESMISRSGKTWKRLGDIAELSSFFIVAEQARLSRGGRASGSMTPARGAITDPSATLVGLGNSKSERGTVVEPLRPPGAARAATAPVRPTSPPPRPLTAPPPNVPVPVAPVTQQTMRMAAPAPQPPAARVPAVAPQSPTLRIPPPVSQSPTLLAPPPAPVAQAPTLLASPPARAARPRTTPPPPPQSTTPRATYAPALPVPPGGHSTGGWATDDVKAMEVDDDEAGPMRGVVRPSDGYQGFGGVVRPAPTVDAAFVSGRVGRLTDEPDPGPEPDLFDDDVLPRRRSATMWIALGSLAVIGAAVGVVYFVFLRAAEVPRAVVTDTADAGALIATADGGVVAPGPGPDAGLTATDDLLEQARVQLGRESTPALIAAEKLLAESGRANAVTLALRARLVTAQAQILEDEAQFADGKTAETVRRESKKLTLTALGLAGRALKADGQDRLANAVMADVLRLQGKPAKDLRRYLDAAGDEREGKLIAALVALRDKDLENAAEILAALERATGALAATGDVRPRWHRARLALAQGKNDDAVQAAQAVLVAQPEHGGARALVAKLASVSSNDPMPPELGGGSGTAAGKGTATPPTGAGTSASTGTGTTPPGPVAGDSYDRLLAKANKLAEVDCGQAMPYFAKALEAQPNGVEALTGMGFCHIDSKQFSSAHSKFRAALGISPRFERALWGVAEAYQQQGRTDLAIKAYEDYLEVYPSSAAAKRQLERLQGKAPAPTPTTPEPAVTPTDPGAPPADGTEPTPAPAPAPASEGAPSATP